ncbi:hypothetical protein [Mycobacterium sp. NAZ190054]|uniref:hypothetical protein n=1 Tax=Mycobacterium sp. NAZ190054 TaxID=1747766 RepID=UPI0007912EC8|nr:hypothetical protein [Mycobacterium sp. NAZ190054]KWX56521.1 hypothetical protein ASJ79_14255 [Mycobacterium sp. NAZ190054]
MTDLLERPVGPVAPPSGGRHRKVAPLDRRGDTPCVEVFALVSAALGVLALAPVPPWVRAVLLAVFVLTGPGLATVVWLRLPAVTAVAVVPVTGLAGMAGCTAVLNWAGLWLPVPLLLSAALAVAGSALLHAGRRRSLAVAWPPALSPERWRITAPYLWIVAALCGWAVALPGMAAAPDSPYGLLFTGTGPALVAVTAVLAAAFVAALRHDALIVAAASIAAVIAVLRLTATLITDLPVYPWTYKHLGIVEFLLQHRAFPSSGVDVYREWPGFFTSFAWFSDVTALDPTTIAHWFAPVTHVVLALVVAALAAAIGLDRRETLAAVMVAELANWVAQDYFAPQAYAFVLGIGVIVTLLASATAPAAGWLSLVLFAALVPTHQLTPYWVFGVVVLLAVTRRLRSAWMVVPYAALLIGYLIPRSYIVFQHGGLSSLNPLANGASNVEYAGSAAKMFTSLVCRGLSAGVVLLALLAVVLWWRKGRSPVIPAVLAFSPFGLLMLNSYGGEAIFRVYLYAVPGCAVLIAPPLVALIRARGGRYVAAIGLAGIAAAGLQGYYGTWHLNVQKPSQLALLDNLIDGIDATRGPATVWNLHTSGFPARATAQAVSLAELDSAYDKTIFERWPGFAADFPAADRFDEVTALAADSAGETFFVFSDEAKTALDYFGHADPATVDRFEDMFADSPVWCPGLQDETTTVYRYQEVCS